MNRILECKNFYPYLLIALIIFQVSLTFVYAVTLRFELKTVAYDGVSFAQAVFNLLNGNGLVSTIVPPYIEQSWLGFHFSPVLYAVAPFYYLFPYVETLLFLHSLFIALAAIPIFFIARKLLESPPQALVVSAFYLINPFIVNAQILDFHEIAFAPLTIALMLWAVLNKRKYWLLFFCAILLTIKEHYGLAVFGTGLLWAWYWREAKFGLGLATIGLISFFAVLKILMPHFNPAGVAAMLRPDFEIDYFNWLMHPFSDKDLLVRIIAEAVFYIVLLFFLFLFQPVFSLAWLFPAVADVAVNSLSNFEMMRQPFSYHSAALMPILLVAYSKTISARYIKRWGIITITSFTVIFFSYSFISLPFFPNNILEFSTPRFSLAEQDETSLTDIKKIIGKTSSVSAQVNILPHIPVRRFMYIFPNRFADADYIVLNTSIPLHDRPSFFKSDFFEAVDGIIDSKDWGLVFHKNNWLVFKRGDERNKVLLDAAKKEIVDFQIKVEQHNKRVKAANRPSRQQ